MPFSQRIPASPLPGWEALEERQSQASSQASQGSSEGPDELENEHEATVRMPNMPVHKRKTREETSPAKTVKKPKIQGPSGRVGARPSGPGPRRSLNLNRVVSPVDGHGDIVAVSSVKDSEARLEFPTLLQCSRKLVNALNPKAAHHLLRGTRGDP
ncbi:hypothetical protein OE88DRAFT_1191573 [Heliocybe sulcata]|uniref:Uncharacterized protein n=1 Tax=Heliocybe sulcata TaxID=5364 RepID=A0A5C3NAR4_9AGAM|nr:hypothetical protein OE88DRAFT_1191573 [Heliocybe sulcata]